MPWSEAMPRSVVNMQRQARVSHVGVPPSSVLLRALRTADSDEARRIAAQAIQESDIAGLADLLADGVLDGAALARLLASLQMTGLIRRIDLVQWSRRFS